MENTILQLTTVIKRAGSAFFLGVAVAGCAGLADLQPSSFQLEGHTDYLKSHGRELLEQAVKSHDPDGKWGEAVTLEVSAVDEWKSNFVRRFTPVEQPSQALKFKFDLKSQDVVMTYLEGKSAGVVLGVEKGHVYRIARGVRKSLSEKPAQLYLFPVRDYFIWPFTLPRASYAGYAGADRLGMVDYWKVFVTNGEPAPSKGTDQYILWINQKTMRIDRIEFTLRSLLPSYQGVVIYNDQRLVDGVWFPFEVVLADDPSGEKVSHRFKLSDVVLK